jgi:hypothetical protein
VVILLVLRAKAHIRTWFRSASNSCMIRSLLDFEITGVFSIITPTACLHCYGQYPVASGIVMSAVCTSANKTACSSFGSMQAL